ncbi:MAG: flagellar motor protein MotB [Candidatus Marinimicrobia bacterium]|nr:flagellar motor protein MotB [Candidatus Neomarinimicrobiota bacterium]MCF7880556.1 flagellar motor protein MotB [Candidatus Neomarinimicrobiota bacterium]
MNTNGQKPKQSFLVFRNNQNEDDGEDWLITYSDMITLLFAFFVVIVAISQVDPVKLQRVSQSMATSVGKKYNQEMDFSLAEIYTSLEKIIEEEGLTGQAEVNYSPVGVVMRFKGNMLFRTASADIQPKAVSVLRKLAKEIRAKPYRIDVEGHTDNRPIVTALYPSNWELSAARASSVVRFFLDEGVLPHKLRAVGRADTKPLRPNEDVRGNPVKEHQAMNRRVEIVFLGSSFN